MKKYIGSLIAILLVISASTTTFAKHAYRKNGSEVYEFTQEQISSNKFYVGEWLEYEGKWYFRIDDGSVDKKVEFVKAENSNPQGFYIADLYNDQYVYGYIYVYILYVYTMKYHSDIAT